MAAIDPRLRDRRIEVARTEGRRRLRRIVWLLAVVALIAGAFALTRSPLLDVDRVAVRGASGGQAAEVRGAAGVERGEPLLSVDLDRVEASIEALPWVAGASASRSWPSEVRVSVRSRTAVAVAGGSDDAVLVDDTGHVLAPATASDVARLPAVAARAAAPGDAISAAGRTAAAVVGGLPGPVRAQVAEVRSRHGEVDLTLRDGIAVRWGDTGQASAKAEALRVLLAQGDRDRFEQIDVSVPRASTITFRDGGGE